jgi:glycosidase
MHRHLFISALLAVWYCSSLAQIQRVEPLNWWVGMKNPSLQLMVYGQKVGELVPRLTYPGVKLVKYTHGDSKNYLFIDLVIDKSVRAGKMTINFTKEGKTVHQYQYELKNRKPGAASIKGFDASDVVYLVTPDRFVNGDTTNDAIAHTREPVINRSSDFARHGGDLRGMINSLPYLKKLGITAVWPQPLLENDMAEYSYHGYAITDFYKVDPRFGTNEDYIEFADKARALGIKLIFDGVLNHIGKSHWWMQDLPFRDWINYAGNPRITTHRRTVNQDPYASRFDTDFFTRGWFTTEMPDMNASNPYTAVYLIQNTIWWVETLGAGGVRQDTYSYSGKDLLKVWTCRMMEEYPRTSLVAEEWSLNPVITSYWQRGRKNLDGYSSCLTSPMDFPLQAALVQALREKEDVQSGKGLLKLYEALANDVIYPEPLNVMVFGDNHDMDRMFTQLGNDTALHKMALAYLCTVRGIPQIYYGTEVLMHNSSHPHNHGVIRSDFPGGWEGDTRNAFSGEGLDVSEKSVQEYLRLLLNWRRDARVIHEGNTKHFVPHDGVYVYFRYKEGATVMVIINKNERAKELDIDRYAEMLKKESSGRNVITGERVTLNGYQVPARAAVVMEIVKN